MKLIILDRDGVINKESKDYIKNPTEWIPIAGSLEAIADLTRAGYTICVATNQSGVGRGYFDLAMLNNIHKALFDAVAKHGGKIHKIYFCPHAPTESCNCRKPKTGMVEQIAADFNITLPELSKFDPIFIGDSLRDLQLGLATGCKVFLVTSDDSHGAETLKEITPQIKQQISIVHDLAAATKQILV